MIVVNFEPQIWIVDAENPADVWVSRIVADLERLDLFNKFADWILFEMHPRDGAVMALAIHDK